MLKYQVVKNQTYRPPPTPEWVLQDSGDAFLVQDLLGRHSRGPSCKICSIYVVDKAEEKHAKQKNSKIENAKNVKNAKTTKVK